MPTIDRPAPTPGRPRLFIGSSKESLAVAQALQAELSDGGETGLEVEVWSQDVFDLSRTALESLLATLAQSDAAVFVVAPDDVATIREVPRRVARDNVVFELGLAMGRLGRSRTFVVAPEPVAALHLPTDLAGLTVAGFDPAHSNLRAALGPAARRIRTAVERVSGPPAPPGSPPATRFGAALAAHRGVRSARPWALAIGLLPGGAPLRGDVETYLEAAGREMPIEEITFAGLHAPADVEALVERVRDARARLDRRGATEVHLFIAGPVVAGALVGMLLDNWKLVKLYHRPLSPPPDLYEYWAPLVKG